MMRRALIIILLLTVAVLVYAFFLPLKMVINSIMPGDMLSRSIMADIRSDLAAQPDFVNKLKLHKGQSKRYLHRTSLTAFTTFDLGMYDVYATYINEDQEWVVRMGIWPDKNAEHFFPQQIGGISGAVLGFALRQLNNVIDAGLLQPMLYHVTDMEETSFVSDSYEAVPRLIPVEQ
ncbi:hypothetical protein [Endozoicomonas ascidiicola]|uniref:hypothetical protein n=1 Tax=Endozoicomonas ascidiicola TaxID=1698521 RepID=UPI00083392C0|nr:hypothetical protein [Endozoicomonas ascidiicola]